MHKVRPVGGGLGQQRLPAVHTAESGASRSFLLSALPLLPACLLHCAGGAPQPAPITATQPPSPTPTQATFAPGIPIPQTPSPPEVGSFVVWLCLDCSAMFQRCKALPALCAAAAHAASLRAMSEQLPTICCVYPLINMCGRRCCNHRGRPVSTSCPHQKTCHHCRNTAPPSSLCLPWPRALQVRAGTCLQSGLDGHCQVLDGSWPCLCSPGKECPAHAMDALPCYYQTFTALFAAYVLAAVAVLS